MLDGTEDSHGHRTDYLYDPVGRLIGLWAPNDEAFSFTHDAGGRLTQIPTSNVARLQGYGHLHPRLPIPYRLASELDFLRERPPSIHQT